MTDFYTSFKSLIDELSELHPLPQRNCGAVKKLSQREQDQYVHLFLGSLDNERFGHVKFTILNADPLPTLRWDFNHILREEARFLAEKEREPKLELGAVFHSNNKKNRDGPRPKCDHCGMVGHEKARCYELVGYPTHWNIRRSNGPSKGNAENGMARLALLEKDQEKMTTSEGNSGGQALFRSHVKYADFMAGKENWVLYSGLLIT